MTLYSILQSYSFDSADSPKDCWIFCFTRSPDIDVVGSDQRLSPVASAKVEQRRGMFPSGFADASVAIRSPQSPDPVKRKENSWSRDPFPEKSRTMYHDVVYNIYIYSYIYTYLLNFIKIYSILCDWCLWCASISQIPGIVAWSLSCPNHPARLTQGIMFHAHRLPKNDVLSCLHKHMKVEMDHDT